MEVFRTDFIFIFGKCLYVSERLVYVTGSFSEMLVSSRAQYNSHINTFMLLHNVRYYGPLKGPICKIVGI